MDDNDTGDQLRKRNASRKPPECMGRRRFVKSAAAAGVSFASASQLSVSRFEAVNGDEVPIVYAYVRDDPNDPDSLTPQVKTVSTEWYNNLQAALSDYETLNLAAIKDVLTASVVPGDEDDPATISVGVTNEETVSRITDLLEGTPIEGSAIESTNDDPHEELDPVRQFDPDNGVSVPGGVACGEAEGTATLASAVYDPETDTQYFATADHLYADTENNELMLVTNGQRIEIGEVEHHYRSEDLALSRPTKEFNPKHAVDGTLTRQVAGQFTRLGLADLKARGTEIHKIGAMTGHTTGQIQAIDGISCIYGDPCKRGQLKWGSESDFTDGDSGSVSYAPDPENPDKQVLICGLNNARTWWPGEDYIWGTGAYVLHEKYGFTF